jgi:hypothetical protein
MDLSWRHTQLPSFVRYGRCWYLNQYAAGPSVISGCIAVKHESFDSEAARRDFGKGCT